jgi:hypothetical protein
VLQLSGRQSLSMSDALRVRFHFAIVGVSTPERPGRPLLASFTSAAGSEVQVNAKDAGGPMPSTYLKPSEI